MSQRLKMLIISLLFLIYVNSYVTESPDGSVCFNNCNKHGDCVDYSCHCWSGYHGDDCSTTFIIEGQRVVPILTAGHYNLTKKNFTTAVLKNKLILVGFSAYSCFRCIVVESEYEKISTSLTLLGVPFARADADKMKSLALEHEASELPALVLFQKHRPLPFKGSHTAESVLAFVEKQIAKPTISLKSVEEVEGFLSSRNSTKHSASTVMVVGFFADRSIEEDDYDDYVEVAKDLQVKEDVYFAVVSDPKTCEWFKWNKTIERTPSVLLLGENGVKSINLDELYGERYGLKEWINRNAIPLVGKLTNSNFKLYEKIPNPMLLLFLDLTGEHSVGSPDQMIGGRSGNILNENLIEEFRHVAKEHSDRITFVYLDGLLHEDRMKSLGLFGGKERLPSLAFNTRDGLQVPFPEELPVNRDTLLQFCADFLSGKLRSAHDTAEMAKKVMQSVLPVNPKNLAKRKEKKEAPKAVRGVSEQYEDGTAGDLAVTTVTLKNFEEVIMDEGKDVMLMLHSKGCERCSHFAVYYKHMAHRFNELNVSSLVVARMDLTDESPPPHLGLVVGDLPLLVMLPAGSKSAPWTYYSGVGKVAPLMKWAQEHAAVPFDLPNLPHLNEDQTLMYKKQVREREEQLEETRMADKRAMDREDRARKEAARKLRNKLKKEAAADKEESCKVESSGASNAGRAEEGRVRVGEAAQEALKEPTRTQSEEQVKKTKNEVDKGEETDSASTKRRKRKARSLASDDYGQEL